MFEKKFFFVESPAKIKTVSSHLSRFLKEKEFTVLSTKGHIRALLPKQYDLKDRSFQLSWKNLDSLSTLNTLLKNHKFDSTAQVFIMTDNDREGEGIGWHLLNFLSNEFSYRSIAYRIRVSELTENAIKTAYFNALADQTTSDENLISAYLTRISIDSIIGFNGSAVAWQRLVGCPAIGRVQSMALSLIEKREREIRNFVSERRYRLSYNDPHFSLSAIKINDKTFEYCTDRSIIEDILDQIRNEKHILIRTYTKTTFSRALSALSTPTALTGLYTKFGLSLSQSNLIMQKLYEGVTINKELRGLITYPRTDSSYINPEFVNEIKKFITSRYGSEFVQDNTRNIRVRSFQTAEAHEAIRVTTLYDLESILSSPSLTSQTLNVYKYIFYCTVAAFMRPTSYLSTYYEYQIGSIMLTIRQIKISQHGIDLLARDLGMEKRIQNIDRQGPDQLDPSAFEIVEYESEGPVRYNEGSIVQELKDLKIGRPSTYASIILRLRAHGYISNIGSTKSIGITNNGLMLIFMLEKYFAFLLDANTTSNIEKSLDDLAKNMISSESVMQDFLDRFVPLYFAILAIDRMVVYQSLESSASERFNNICRSCKNPFLFRIVHKKMFYCCVGDDSRCHQFYDLERFGYATDTLRPVVSYSPSRYNFTRRFKEGNTYNTGYTTKRSTAKSVTKTRRSTAKSTSRSTTRSTKKRVRSKASSSPSVEKF